MRWSKLGVPEVLPVLCFWSAAVLWALSPLLVSASPVFVPLGDLGGGFGFYEAAGLSPDGSVVVGRTSTGEPISWSPGGGVNVLEIPPFRGYPDAASLTGSVVVGFSGDDPELDCCERPVVWTEGDLSYLPGNPEREGRATDISDDGAVVVGWEATTTPAEDNIGELDSEAVRWTESRTVLGPGRATGVSTDGLVVVGEPPQGPNGEQSGDAWRWEGGVREPIGHLSGGSWSTATAISGDGLVIVGVSDVGAQSREAFRWTQAMGILGLGELAGGSYYSYPMAVSADGSTIVGFSSTSGGSPAFSAFIWTEALGMRNLQDVLQQSGVDLTGWHLTRAIDISADGHTIIGFGSRDSGPGEPWLVQIPEPSTLALASLGLLVLGAVRRARRS
jgi:probable HAF family extracellular repeat protein